MKKSISEAIKYILSAVGVTMAAILIIFGVNGILPGGDRNFVYGDAIDQFVPVIKMYLRHLFGGEGLAYSFETGLGMPTVALYAYYCLSPFNLLFLLIDDPDISYFVVFSAKLISASATMAYLLYKRREISAVSAAILSTAYVLCGFVLNFMFGIIFFDMMIIMPVLLLALIRFVETGRWIALCIVYSLSFMIHFYSAYMLGIFSFVLFLCYAAQYYGKDRAKWIKGSIRYCICVAFAIMIASPVLLPTAIELFSHLGSDHSTLESFRVSPLDSFSCFFPGFSTTAYNKVPVVYCGLLPVLFFVTFFLCGEGDRRKKILAAVPIVFLLICSFWKPAYLIMHAFDAPDGYCFRFSWLIGFWIIYIAAEEYEKTMRGRTGGIIAILLALMYFAFMMIKDFIPTEGEPYFSVQRGGIGTAFLLLYVCIMWLGKIKEKSVRLLNLVFFTEILCNGVITESAFIKDNSRNGAYYAIWREQADEMMGYISAEEQKDSSLFYRVQFDNDPIGNISMLCGVNGLGCFLTIENERIRDVLGTLGYATSPSMVQDYGSTEITRMLLSQKYSAEFGSFYSEHPEQYDIQKNALVLPPAYMVSESIVNTELVKKDPFSAQEQLAEVMTGETYELWRRREDAYTVQCEYMSWVPYDDGVFLQRESDTEDGKMTYRFTDNGEEQLYIYLSRDPDSTDDKYSPLLFSNRDRGGLFNRPRLLCKRIMPAAKNADGEWEFYLYMPKWGYAQVAYQNLYAAGLDRQELKRLYDRLSAGGIELSYVSESEWRGSVEAKEDCPILFTTIPYDEGWEVYADGRKTETLSLLEGAFLGVRLEAGRHEIRFVYGNRRILYGALIGAVGILGIIGITLRRTKKCRMKLI